MVKETRGERRRWDEVGTAKGVEGKEIGTLCPGRPNQPHIKMCEEKAEHTSYHYRLARQEANTLQAVTLN